MANFGRARTWTTSEKLTAVDLNAEFDNIINNVTSGGINADNIDLTDDYTWTGSHVFSGSGTTTQVQINNTNTDGDSYLSFALSGTLVHSMGVDDGDSDKFKIGTTAIGTGTWFEKDSTTLTLSSLLTVGVNDTGYDVQFFGATAGAHMLWDESADTLKLVGAAKIDAQGTVTVGVNDTGFDVQLFGAASGAYSLWDESANTQVLRGATAAGAGTLILQTAELTNVDGGILGRIDFQAPLDAAGTDAVLVGASIWAEADDTFSSTLNDTDLVFAVAESETALERMRLGYDGTNVELTFSGATTVSAGGAIVTVSDPIQHNATFTAGVDGTGYDFKLFGATASAHLLWDESADDLKLVGAAGLTVAGTSALTVTTASTITASGVVSVDDVTDSTSGITGSIHTDGGLGVVKDIAGGNDLLLTSSGAIINFNAGDVTITHATNTLTVGGGNFKIGGGFISVESLDHIYVDGGSNTSIRESAADTMAFQLGGTDGMVLANSILTLGRAAATNAVFNAPEGMYFNTDSDASQTGTEFVWGHNRATDGGGNEIARLEETGNLLIGGNTSGASSINSLHLFVGTAPTGSAVNGVILYADGANAELIVRDEAGNLTTLSPHKFSMVKPSEKMAWSYYSERDGRAINVDMLKLVRLVEELTGDKLVHIGDVN